jgi:hypothetical protein
MTEFFNLFQQILTLFGQYMNVYAMFTGIAAILVIRRLVPNSDPTDNLSTVPGTPITRLLPLVGPTVAVVTCIVLEWDKAFTAMDFVRGVTSGMGSEFMLRLYFKSFAGK